jgi:hypothetical protein
LTSGRTTVASIRSQVFKKNVVTIRPDVVAVS